MAQFQYQPPTGPISGISVLGQTELAINDLHDHVDNADAGIAGAQTTANAAQAAANDAKAQAAQAQSTADDAMTGVAQVRQMATDAQTSADNAMTRANDAYDLAAASGSQADQVATGLSNHIDDKANPHEVTAAQTGAYTTTQTDALINSLIPMIDAAMGTFRTETTDIDVNALYDDSDKIYLTGVGTTNLPPDITIPAWLMVYTNDDNTAATQRCWDSSATHLIYERTGTINNSDPLNPVVTWRPWNTIASPTVVKSVTVEVDPPGQPAGTYLVFVMETSTGDVTTYVNMSQVSGGGYTSGNGAIDISADNKISLQLDSSNSEGLIVAPTGLQTRAAIAQIPGGVSPGMMGMVIPDGISTTITPEGVLSVIGGGDIAAHNADLNAHDVLFGPKIRRRLTSNLKLYIRTDGNDANDGSADTPESAFKTVTAALNYLTKFDGSGYSVVISIGSGTYNEEITIGAQHMATFNNVTLRGAGNNSVILDTPTDFSIIVQSFVKVRLSGLMLKGAIALYFFVDASLQDDMTLDFYKSSTTAIINMYGSQLNITGTLNIGGDAYNVFNVSNRSLLLLNGTMNIYGNPMYSNAFVFCNSNSGIIRGLNSTFSGTARGPRHNVDWNSFVNTRGMGINFFPGDTPGIVNANNGGILA